MLVNYRINIQYRLYFRKLQKKLRPFLDGLHFGNSHNQTFLLIHFHIGKYGCVEYHTAVITNYTTLCEDSLR